MPEAPRPAAPATSPAGRFKCPACGFTVFNRRVPRCEACQAALPATLAYSATELALLEAEAQRLQSLRQDLAQEAEREAEQRRRSDGYWGP